MAISGIDAVSGVSGAYRVYFHLNNKTNLLPIKQVNFPYQNTPSNPLEDSPRSWQIGSFYSLFNFLINNSHNSKAINSELPKEECHLCNSRRYVCSNGETSDGISTIIPGRQSALRVQHHEAQHLHQARIKAVQEGKVVVAQQIQLQHAICPECGGTYVSGGQAVTQILDKQEFQKLIQSPKPTYRCLGELNNQRPEGKGINIDLYG